MHVSTQSGILWFTNYNTNYYGLHKCIFSLEFQQPPLSLGSALGVGYLLLIAWASIVNVKVCFHELRLDYANFINAMLEKNSYSER